MQNSIEIFNGVFAVGLRTFFIISGVVIFVNLAFNFIKSL